MNDRSLGRRQRWAWLLAGWSGVTAICLCGSGWVWVLAGAAIVTGYDLLLDRLLPEGGLGAALCAGPGWSGRICSGLMYLWLVVELAWVGALADWAFPRTNGFPELGIVLLAVTAWGIWKGTAACARCGGVLCMAVLVLYGTVAAFALPDCRLEYGTPQGEWSETVKVVGLCLIPTALWLLPRKKEGRGTALPFTLLIPLGAGALALICGAALSPELAAAEPVALYTLAQSISLFGVMERMEPLLSAAMTMSLLALLSILAAAARTAADQILPRRWTGAAACVLAMPVMLAARDMPWQLLAAGNGAVWVVLPLLCALRRRT